MSWLDRIAARAGVERDWNTGVNTSAQTSAPADDSAWKYISAGDIKGLADYTNREYNYHNIPYIGQGIGHTANNATMGLANLAQFLGADSVSNYLYEKGKEGEAQLPEYREPELSLSYALDPNGLLSAGAMVAGSMLSMAPVAALAPVGGIAAGAARLAGNVPKVGGLLSNLAPGAVRWATTGPIEAMMEGGGTEREMLENGASREAANAAAWDVFKKNAALLTATNALEGGLLGKLGVKTPAFKNPVANGISRAAAYAPQTAAEAVLQGYEEGAQEGIQAAAMGNGANTAAQILNPSNWTEGQWGAAKMGFAGGLPLVGGMAIARRLGNRVSRPSSDAPMKSSGDENIDALIAQAAEKYGVPVNLLHSIAQTESEYNQDARSEAGAIGMMQLMPDTAAGLGVDPNDLAGNIEGGAKYMRELLDTFDGDVEKAVAAYNAGPNAVKKHGGIPPYAQTQDYVRKVLGGLDGYDASVPQRVRSLLEDATPFLGVTMDNGENGCVEAVTKIGAKSCPFLAQELSNGVVNVDRLVADAGNNVIPFDPNQLEEGDVIVYGNESDPQRHVVLYDGKGGYIGNSTEQNKVVQGADYNAMGTWAPTKIIKTGAQFGGAHSVAPVMPDFTGLIADETNIKETQEAIQNLINTDRLTPAQRAAILQAAEMIRDTPIGDGTDPVVEAENVNEWQRLIDRKDIKGIFEKDPQKVVQTMTNLGKEQRAQKTRAAIENQQQIEETKQAIAAVQTQANTQPVQAAQKQGDQSVQQIVPEQSAQPMMDGQVSPTVPQVGDMQATTQTSAPIQPENVMQMPQEAPSVSDAFAAGLQSGAADAVQTAQPEQPHTPVSQGELEGILSKVQQWEQPLLSVPEYVAARNRQDWAATAQIARAANVPGVAQFYGTLMEHGSRNATNITPYAPQQSAPPTAVPSTKAPVPVVGVRPNVPTRLPDNIEERRALGRSLGRFMTDNKINIPKQLGYDLAGGRGKAIQAANDKITAWEEKRAGQEAYVEKNGDVNTSHVAQEDAQGTQNTVDNRMLAQRGTEPKNGSQSVREKSAQKQGERITPKNKAKQKLREIQGKEIVNKETGIPAVLNAKGINKMLSNAAVAKSRKNGYTQAQHLEAVENIKTLYENATLTETAEDKNGSPNIASIKRFSVDTVVGNEKAHAKITVKESVLHGHRIYSVELEALEKPVEQGKRTDIVSSTDSENPSRKGSKVSADYADGLSSTSTISSEAEESKEKPLSENEREAVKGLSADAKNVYQMVRDKLTGMKNKKVARAASAGAVLLARHADIIARKVRATLGTPFTAMDYYRSWFALQYGGEADGFTQALNAGVNLDEQVPVVDITAALPQQKMSNKDILNFIRGLVQKNDTITSADGKAVFSILPKDVRHITFSSNKKASSKEFRIRKAGVLSIQDLLQNAVLVESTPNRKTGKKPNVRAYHRFYVPVRFGNDLKTLRIVAEEQNGAITLQPTDVNLYDIIVEQKAARTPAGIPPVMGSANSLSTISIRDMLTGVKDADGNVYAQRRAEMSDAERKEMQFRIIEETNPMHDDIHTGIRSVDDILTAKEAFGTKVDEDSYAYPDFTEADGKAALKNGEVTIYSSYPIAPGVFVTPSKMQAQDYAGSGKVYSKKVSVKDIAWIHSDEGQYTPIETESFNQSVWHGTPHDFDGFDIGAIGTGEGAQVHGWGLYFAQERSTSEGYKERLTKTTKVYSNEKVYTFEKNGSIKTNDGETLSHNDPLNEALHTFQWHDGDIQAAITFQQDILAREKRVLETVNDFFEDVDEDSPAVQQVHILQETIRILENEAKAWQLEKHKGSLFEVEIPDNDVLLDEQKPFDEQPKFVQEKLEELFEKNDSIDLLDNVLQLPVKTPELRQTLGFMRLARKNIRASKEAIDVLRDVLDKSASRSDRINAYRALMDEDIVDFDEMTDSYEDDIDNIEASKDYLEDVLSSYENGLKRQKGSYQKLLDSLPEDMNLARMVLSKMRSGREIYLMLSNHLGEDKEASLALNEVGIKGITYVGGRDGRCFVVFDDKAISIIDKFNQQMNEIVKGTTQDVRDGQRIVSLFEEADESTFLHEMGHLFLLDLERMADMSPTSAQELQTVKNWAAWSEGQTEEYKKTPFETEFVKLDADIRASLKKGDEKTANKLKRQWEHERFARGFEMYLKHGEAPTKGLRAVFAKFRAFLQRVYQAFTGTGGRATAEVEAVMARMIAMEDSSDLSAYPQGKKTNVYTDSGKKIPVQYRVVSADDLIASHDAGALEINPGYPVALQPRDRERVMMRQQVTGMANTLRPEDLADARNLNQGAPLIRNDGVVLNGNGRTIAIARAQARNKERATAYRDYLVENAAIFGFSKEEVESVKNPVLVREVQGGISDVLMQEIIGSTTGGARMGASEAAQQDAGKITFAMLDAYVPNDKGDLTTAANRSFVAGILHKLVGKDEMNAYLDKDGHVNADGIQRVKRALFALAYGDDELIAKMAESTDDDIRNVSNGLMSAAPMVARLSVKKGVPYVKELQDAITDAVKQLDTLRRSGENVKDYLSAQALFTEHEDSAEMRAILSFLDENKRSGKRIATYFSRTAKTLDEMEVPSGNELFDAEMPSLMDVLEGARGYAENGGQEGLFGDNAQEVTEIKTALVNLARAAWSDKKAQGKVSFKPSQKLRDKVREFFGHDIDEVFITADDMRHMKNAHSDGEEKRGQVNLTPEDFAEVYHVVNEFDSATKERDDRRGNQNILVVKNADGRMFALLVERGKNKAEIKTVYKYKKPSPMSDAISPNLNARSDSAKVSSISNIPLIEVESKQEPTLEEILQLAPALKKAALEYGARDENGKVTFPDEARKQEFIKVAKALLGAGERKTSARRQESLKEMLDGIRLIPPTRVSPRKRVIADWGREMGVSVVFFKGDPSLHGFHQDGVTFLNVDSEITPQWTFWHEAMHWMKANNPDIYDDIVEAISGAEGFTKEQLDAYRKAIGAPDMSDADVIEEMIADALPDVRRRVPLLRELGRRDAGVVQRVVAWIRDVMRRFHDHFHTPKGGLTSAQRIAMTRAFGNLVGSIRDAEGKAIFRIENEGARITLRNGKPLPAVKYSLDKAGREGDNENRISDAVFGKYLNDGIMKMVQDKVSAEIGEHVDLSAMSDPVARDAARDRLPYIRKMLADYNTNAIQNKPAYRDRLAAKIEYARRCFDNDPRVQHGAVRQVDGHDRPQDLYRTGQATLSGRNDGRGVGETGRQGTRGVSRSVSGERSGARAHFDKLYEDMRKHLESQGAFSMPKFSANTQEDRKGNFKWLTGAIRSLVGVAPADNLELPGRVQRTVTLSPKDLEKRIRERWIQEKNIISKEKQKDGKIAVTYYPDTHDVGYADYVKSVRQVAKRNPFVKVLYDLAHKAMKKQEKLRNEFGKALKEFNDLVKNEKDLKSITAILWQGDAEGRVFSDAELRALGANERVIKAYKLVRRELEKAYKMLRDAQTQVKTRSQTLEPESVESFKKSHWIEDADVISAVPRADGMVLLTWRGGRTYDVKGKTMDAEALELMKKDENVNVTSAIPKGDGTFSVSYVERIKPVFRRTGYMPHFFHEWMIYEKYKDPKTGEERYTSVASGRTMNEAVKIGNEIAAKNKDKQYVLRPKGFDLGTENAVVVGDMDFAQMSRKLAESTEISLADARSLLLDDAGMSLKSRHRFFGSLLERKDGKGFDQDVQWVLAHYLNGAARYIAMEDFKPPAISMYERFFGRFDDEPKNLTAQYCKNFINDVNGNPRNVEVWLNDLIKKTPIGKYVADSFGDRVALALNGELSTWNAITKLGLFNFASAAVNFSQFINVGAALNDYGYAMKGLKKALNPSAMDEKIIEASGLLDDINMADDNGGYTQRRGGKVRGIYSALKKGGEWTLIPFQKADTLMRKAAVLGAYYQGIEQKGMKTAPGDELSAEALAYAQEINDDANFDYSSANAPNMLRAGSVVTQQLFQFQKYPIMQFEFMYNILKNGTRGQKVRMFVPYVLFCGIPASIPFGALFNQLFSFLFGFATGDDEDIAEDIKAEVLRWAGKDPVKKAIAETALYGVLAPTFGLDISGRIGMSNAFGGEFYGKKPESVGEMVAQQLGGPAVNSAVNMFRQFHEGNPIEALKAVSPALGNMAQAWVGESRTTRHRVNVRYDTAYDKIAHALGFRSVEESKNAFIMNYEYEQRGKAAQIKREAIQDYIADPSDENRRTINALGITDKQIKEARIQQERTALERAREGRPKTSNKSGASRRRKEEAKRETLYDTLDDE